jgi:hypothetical protein
LTLVKEVQKHRLPMLQGNALGLPCFKGGKITNVVVMKF